MNVLAETNLTYEEARFGLIAGDDPPVFSWIKEPFSLINFKTTLLQTIDIATLSAK